MAGIVGAEKVNQDKQYSEKVNVEYTMDLASLAIHHRASKFIYISSGHVYGNTEEPAIETQSLNPLTLYAEQKSRAEEKLKSLFKDNYTTLIILRVFSVINLQNTSSKPSLGSQIKKILDGDEDIWINNGDDIRDFLGVSNVSEILNKVAMSKDLHGIYNVCSGVPMSVKDVVISTLEKNGIYNFSQIREGNSDLRRNFGSKVKLSEILRSDNAPNLQVKN